MENYNGLKLRPLFYSEISSSFMIYEIFNNHKEIAKELIKDVFDLTVDGEITIIREKNYPKKGSIDIFLSFMSKGKKTIILTEVKVHDYLSVSTDQIKIYYEAAAEESADSNIYFIYLTQFNRNNLPPESEVTFPNSIKEFDNSLKVIPEDKIKHINWEEFHNFMKSHKNNLSMEYAHILELHKSWITAKSKEDIKLNVIDEGIKGVQTFFPDINIDIEKELNFGNIYLKNKRKILTVDLEKCNPEQLNKIFNIIKSYSSSNNINKSLNQITEADTLQAAMEFLKSLSEIENNWSLLSFYSALFDFVNNSEYLLLYGTGTRGFSIKVSIKRKGTISMCTLWANKKIDFSIKK